MKFLEEKIQESIVKRFWELVNYKQLPADCVMYSNRNENNVGGKKGIQSGARFKRMGRFAGVPDLTLLYNGKIAFIEVKTPAAHKTSKGIETKSKGMSKEQIYFYDTYIKTCNIPFSVVSSVIDFDKLMQDFKYKYKFFDK